MCVRGQMSKHLLHFKFIVHLQPPRHLDHFVVLLALSHSSRVAYHIFTYITELSSALPMVSLGGRWGALLSMVMWAVCLVYILPRLRRGVGRASSAWSILPVAVVFACNSQPLSSQLSCSQRRGKPWEEPKWEGYSSVGGCLGLFPSELESPESGLPCNYGQHSCASGERCINSNRALEGTTCLSGSLKQDSDLDSLVPICSWTS